MGFGEERGGGGRVPRPLSPSGTAGQHTHPCRTPPAGAGLPEPRRRPTAFVARTPTRDHGVATREPRKQLNRVRSGPGNAPPFTSVGFRVKGTPLRPAQLPRPRLPGQPGPQPPAQPRRAGRRHLPAARGAGPGTMRGAVLGPDPPPPPRSFGSRAAGAGPRAAPATWRRRKGRAWSRGSVSTPRSPSPPPALSTALLSTGGPSAFPAGAPQPRSLRPGAPPHTHTPPHPRRLRPPQPRALPIASPQLSSRPSPPPPSARRGTLSWPGP